MMMTDTITHTSVNDSGDGDENGGGTLGGAGGPGVNGSCTIEGTPDGGG